MRQIEEDTGEAHFILHHQHTTAAALVELLAIIGERRRSPRHWRSSSGTSCRRRHRQRCRDLRHWLALNGVFDQALGQQQSEGTAHARHAADHDRATEQRGQVARDGQPQAGAAITAVGGAIGLAEGLEDRLLLIRSDADAGIAHGEGQVLVVLPRHAEGHAATVSELEGVGQQVAQDLFGTLAICEQHLRQLALLLDLETQTALAGQRYEYITQAFEQARQRRALGAYL